MENQYAIKKAKEALLREIRDKRLPVIIFGAGIVGKALLTVCKNAGVAVEAFCDSSTKVSQSAFCGKQVLYAPELKKKYENAVFIISVAAIKDAADLLSDLGFKEWYAGGLLLKDLDVSWRKAGKEIEYTKYALESCIVCHEGYLNPDKLFLRSADLIITERCSLRCKDCSNLMQYYDAPKDCDTGMLMKSIDVILRIFDEVMEFRVIGGDVFMNKEWPLIVERLAVEPKARRVVLYTNGTILPSQNSFSNLKNDKVHIVVTDYGALSRKLAEFIAMCKTYKIAYYVLKVNEWLDCSAIAPHKRSVAENNRLFKFCCAKNMATLSDGKLFRCPYAAHAARLSAVPRYKEDYIDLFKQPLDMRGIRKTKSKVRKYLSHKEYLKTCDYCNGRPLSGPEVPVAMQSARPKKYHKYVA